MSNTEHDVDMSTGLSIVSRQGID